jgi:hypothetical protein
MTNDGKRSSHIVELQCFPWRTTIGAASARPALMTWVLPKGVWMSACS